MKSFDHKDEITSYVQIIDDKLKESHQLLSQVSSELKNFPSRAFPKEKMDRDKLQADLGNRIKGHEKDISTLKADHDKASALLIKNVEMDPNYFKTIKNTIQQVEEEKPIFSSDDLDSMDDPMERAKEAYIKKILGPEYTELLDKKIQLTNHISILQAHIASFNKMAGNQKDQKDSITLRMELEVAHVNLNKTMDKLAEFKKQKSNYEKLFAEMDYADLEKSAQKIIKSNSRPTPLKLDEKKKNVQPIVSPPQNFFKLEKKEKKTTENQDHSEFAKNLLHIQNATLEIILKGDYISDIIKQMQPHKSLRNPVRKAEELEFLKLLHQKIVAVDKHPGKTEADLIKAAILERAAEKSKTKEISPDDYEMQYLTGNKVSDILVVLEGEVKLYRDMEHRIKEITNSSHKDQKIDELSFLMKVKNFYDGSKNKPLTLAECITQAKQECIKEFKKAPGNPEKRLNAIFQKTLIGLYETATKSGKWQNAVQKYQAKRTMLEQLSAKSHVSTDSTGYSRSESPKRDSPTPPKKK